jgi:hypothetical protein
MEQQQQQQQPTSTTAADAAPVMVMMILPAAISSSTSIVIRSCCTICRDKRRCTYMRSSSTIASTIWLTANYTSFIKTIKHSRQKEGSKAGRTVFPSLRYWQGKINTKFEVAAVRKYALAARMDTYLVSCALIIENGVVLMRSNKRNLSLFGFFIDYSSHKDTI